MKTNHEHRGKQGKIPSHNSSTDVSDQPHPPRDLDYCPRCGQKIERIVWGQTDCPRCGLHFECC